ncbi:PAS domain-containing sensor histidine kinase [Bacillus solimangrovi]|uniref:histidine kinase n=1 Tax=Bacillus solimangrovi TaxID=1305675 RepID=A0A1E5LGB3_9BACI|nr:PAS domain-containing sensor histidine kinase [Bacillus solimangrovi]OEH93112.1 hypothetical protein BFG57_13235 [Bacillus solimangrovi]
MEINSNAKSLVDKNMKRLLNLSDHAFFIFDSHCHIQFANEVAEDLFRFVNVIPPTQVIDNLFNSKWRDVLYKQVETVKHTTDTITFETNLYGVNATEKRVVWTIEYDNKDKLIYAIVKEVPSISDKYGELLIHNKDATEILGIDGKVIKVNEEFEKVYGWMAQEVVGKEISLESEEKVGGFKGLIKNVMHGDELINYSTRRKKSNGSVIFINLTISTICDNSGQVEAFIVTTRDITEQKAIEQKLNEQSKLFKQTDFRLGEIVESIVDGFFAVDKNWNFIYVNHRLEEIWGVDREELLDNNVWEVFPSVLGTVCESEYRKSMEDGESVRFQIFYDVLEKYVEIRTFPFTEGMVVYIRNIDEQYKMLEKFKKSEEYINQITENTKEVFVIHRSDYSKIFYLSAAFEKVWGISRKALLEYPMENYIQATHPDDRALVINFGKTDIKTYAEVEHRFYHKDMGIRWIRWRRYPAFKDVDGIDRTISIYEDVTEIKEKDLLLRKWDKLGLVGELSASIAHEIRNPVTAIKGFIQLMKDNDGVRYTEVILSELRNIEKSMNELLVLAKPHQELKFNEADLHTVIEEVFTLMVPVAAHHHVQIKQSFEAKHSCVTCEVVQLKQVFINVIKNAIEAMYGSGQVVIQTINKDEKFISVFVKDEGIGISKERLLKLGEPYFSNKEKGIGLGLMISYKIIENHQGEIFIRSELGKGTEVEIRLPVHEVISLPCEN